MARLSIIEMRSVWRFRRLSCALVLVVGLGRALLAQDPTVSLRPTRPVLGEAFSLSITVPNLSVQGLVLPEPGFSSGLRFLGSRMQPVRGGLLIEYSFSSQAVAASQIRSTEGIRQEEEVLVFIEVNGRRRDLGAWRLALEVPSRLLEPSPAFWQLSEPLYPYQPARLRLGTADGRNLPLPDLPAIPGLRWLPSADRDSILLMATDAFSLPPVEFSLDGQDYRVAERAVGLREWPARTDDDQAWPVAVGQYTARFEEPLGRLEPGARLSLAVHISGCGAAVWFTEPQPILLVTDQDGSQRRIELKAKESQKRFSPLDDCWQADIRFLYAISLESAGQYRLSLPDSLLFDPEIGGYRLMVAEPLHFSVAAPGLPDWQADSRLVSQVQAWVDTQARRQPDWRPSSLALAADDPAGALAVLPERIRTLISGLGLEDSTLRLGIIDLLRAGLWPSELRAASGLYLLADRRVAALRIGLAAAWSPLAGRSAWGLPVAYAEALDLSAADQAMLRPRWPHPDWWLMAGLVCILFVLLFVGWKVGLRRSRPGLQPWLALALALIVLAAGAVAAWRDRPTVLISTGEVVRAVPSCAGQVVFMTRPGQPSRLVQQASDWRFVAFSDGRTGWLLIGD